MNKFFSLLKSSYYKIKYGKTLALIDIIRFEENENHIIKEIQKASLSVLNQEVDSFIKAQKPNFDYETRSPEAAPTVLAVAFRNSSEKVINALLEKNVDIFNYNPFYYLFFRRYEFEEGGKSLIRITEKMLEKGLDINWHILEELGTEKNQAKIVKKKNFIDVAIKACNTTLDEKGHEKSNSYYELLSFLIEKGLKKQDSEGELILTAIKAASTFAPLTKAINLPLTQQNQKLIDSILSLEGIDEEYIKKGLKKCKIENDNTFNLRYNQEAIEYVVKYLEKSKLEKLIVDNVDKSEKKVRARKI